MKQKFELTPFEEELKKWYLEHHELMPWELFLMKEQEIRRSLNTRTNPWAAIDPCYRDYQGAVYDKNLGFVDFKNLTYLMSGNYCFLGKQPRYFPNIPFQGASGFVIYDYSGSSEIIVSDDHGEETYILKEGDFFFISSRSRITILCNTDDSIVLHMSFSPDRMFPSFSMELPTVFLSDSPFQNSLARSGTLYYSTGDDPRIQRIIDDMLSESMEQKQNCQSILFHLMNQLILYVSREYECTHSDSSPDNRTYIPAFQQYLKDHFAEFSLQQMAEEFHLSASHICRLYKQHTGTTLLHSLKEIRMKIAEYLLINTYESVDSIAFHIGYTDTSYFIEVFKKTYDSTPFRYRRLKSQI